MALFKRTEILDRLREKVAEGNPIVGGGAGTSISEKMSEAGGSYLLILRVDLEPTDPCPWRGHGWRS